MLTGGSEVIVDNPTLFPEIQVIQEIREPVVNVYIMVPGGSIDDMMQLILENPTNTNPFPTATGTLAIPGKRDVFTRQSPSRTPLSRRHCSTSRVMFRSCRRRGISNQSSFRYDFIVRSYRGAA